MRDFLKEIKDKVLVFDGSMGTMLHRKGMKGGECPESWNVTHKEEVKDIYKSYKEAGSDVIRTNTFQANRPKLEEYSLDDKTYEFNFEAARLAKEVMGNDGFVAASIGPIGELFEPSGELTFEKAFETYKEQIKAVVDGGVGIISFETFTDLADMRAAFLAAKEVTDLPVICSFAFEANGRTLMGTDPYTCAIVLKSLGADMIGTNCSFGPEHLVGIVKKMHDAGGIYISVKPNAGLPELVNGEAVFKESPKKFAELAKEFVNHGVRLIGGCCGTSPEFISAIKTGLEGVEVPMIEEKNEDLITSGVRVLHLKNIDKLSVGKIDAGEDSELLEELSGSNLEFIVDKAIDLSCEDCDAVYINVDKVNGDESLLAGVVNTAQGYVKAPFIIESDNPVALDKALKVYRGIAGVIVGEESGEELLRIVKKYGSRVIDRSLMG